MRRDTGDIVFALVLAVLGPAAFALWLYYYQEQTAITAGKVFGVGLILVSIWAFLWYRHYHHLEEEMVDPQ